MTPQEKSVNERSNEEVAQKIFNESGINGIVLKDPRILIKEALDAKDAEITRLTKEINASRILYDQYRTGAKSEYSIYEAKLADSEKKLAEVKEENERLRSALGVDHTVWCASLQDKYDTLKSQLAEMVEAIQRAIKVTMRTSQGAFAERLDETYVILNEAL